MVPMAGSRSPSSVEATEPIVEAGMDLDVAEVHSASLEACGVKLPVVSGRGASVWVVVVRMFGLELEARGMQEAEQFLERQSSSSASCVSVKTNAQGWQEAAVATVHQVLTRGGSLSICHRSSSVALSLLTLRGGHPRR